MATIRRYTKQREYAIFNATTLRRLQQLDVDAFDKLKIAFQAKRKSLV
jgi:hypothetical protein